MNQISFDDVLSHDDWGIYLSSVSVGDAEPKENYVDIPFGDGALDLTEALTGEVSYKNRPLQALFTLKPPSSEWPELLQLIRSYLNGRKRAIRLVTEEPEYYLVGRCKTSFEKDGALGRLTVTATCEPWKYKSEPTIENVAISTSGSVELKLSNSRKRVIPIITTSADVTISFNGKSISLNQGSHRSTGIILTEGDNRLVISGEPGSDVSFEYQEGAL